MATLRERLRAKQEERRLRSFTMIREDDLRAVAKHGYEGVLSTERTAGKGPQPLHHRHACRSIGRVTALQQRRCNS